MTNLTPQLTLYDTRQRKVKNFIPLDPSNIRIYFCGPTVYDLLHIGNLRAMLTADMLVRLLRYLYPKVTYVRNITDVDDKINARAKLNHETIESLTERTTLDFHEDMQAMHILPPDIEPRATQHIEEIQQLINKLIQSGHAYEAGGHVLFAVKTFAEYGSLSKRNPDELLAGARVEVAPYKKDPGDFVLWKPSVEDEPGWESPWGRGRPGWHIECSAMSNRYLGESFDIHGGGQDLMFPHHENENAQSHCCFPDGKFANTWIHNAMLLVDGEKMSKSLGNFFTIREVLETTEPEALRLALLLAHYRSVLNFSRPGLAEAKRILDRFYRAIAQLSESDKKESQLPQAFLGALCEDLNTPKALTVMHQLADQALKGDKIAASQLYKAGQMMGLLNHDPEKWFQNADNATEIEQLIALRTKAKDDRDFVKADTIRDQLKDQGIILEDGPDGTIWRRV